MGIKATIKNHPDLMSFVYFCTQKAVKALGLMIPVQKKTMMFVSLSGRNYDDSPKAIYEEVCKRHEFDDWQLIWAFKDPNSYEIPRGEKIRFGTVNYWMKLLRSKVWVDNGGIDLGLNLNRKRNVVVRTWHGSVLKYAEEKEKPVLKKFRAHQRIDNRSIRCAQNDLDIKELSKYFRASEQSFLKCGLPRNDQLLHYSEYERYSIRRKLGIPNDKRVILYMPTWRDYIKDEGEFLSKHSPIDVSKWSKELGSQYVLLFRGHYFIAKALKLDDSSFVRNVSDYHPLSDLYSIADIMISDYSSAYYDFSVLCKPIRCYAYDLAEYSEKRGLLVDLDKLLPCEISKTEDDLIDSILNIDYERDCKRTKEFRNEYMKYFQGKASESVVDEIIKRLKGTQ